MIIGLVPLGMAVYILIVPAYDPLWSPLAAFLILILAIAIGYFEARRERRSVNKQAVRLVYHWAEVIDAWLIKFHLIVGDVHGNYTRIKTGYSSQTQGFAVPFERQLAIDLAEGRLTGAIERLEAGFPLIFSELLGGLLALHRDEDTMIAQVVQVGQISQEQAEQLRAQHIEVVVQFFPEQTVYYWRAPQVILTKDGMINLDWERGLHISNAILTTVICCIWDSTVYRSRLRFHTLSCSIRYWSKKLQEIKVN